MEIRLLGLGNVSITKVDSEFQGDFVGDGDTTDIQKFNGYHKKMPMRLR